MDKQKLLDQAIEDWQGVYKPDCPFVYGYTGPKNYTACAFGLLPSYGYIFSQTEFEKRAKGLGWINGYKWGVEYPTNGEKPDLPDDVLVERQGLNSKTWFSLCSSWAVRWDNCSAFRIVDDRYKPMSKSEPEMSKECLNDFPFIGCLAEHINWGVPIKIKFLGERFFIAEKTDASIGKDREVCGSIVELRPIKTEREKFVETALAEFDKKSDKYQPTKSEWLTKLFGEMYDVGCRFVSQESIG